MQDNSWKTFESTGSIQEYLRYKQQQNNVAKSQLSAESKHADCNTGTRSARSENR